MSKVGLALASLWRAVLSQGAHPLGTLRSRAVMGLNRYCLIASAVYFPVAISLFILDADAGTAVGWWVVAAIGAWIAGPLLNAIRLHAVALALALMVPVGALTMATAEMSRHSGFHLPVVAVTGLAFILLMPHQRWWRAAVAVVAGGLLVTIYVHDAFRDQAPGFSDQVVITYAVVNVVLVSLMTYIVAWYNSSYFMRERKRNDKLLEAAHNAAQTDSLTEVPNRRGITPIMSDVARRGPYALALADLDHFKRVNDRLGHGAGDVVLANVARSLVRAVGTDGVVGRWGGEEFVVVMETGSVEDATAVMERARLAIAREFSDDGYGNAVTMSVGVSVAPQFTPRDEVLRHADMLLYRAKRAGRNRTTAGSVTSRVRDRGQD